MFDSFVELFWDLFDKMWTAFAEQASAFIALLWDSIRSSIPPEVVQALSPLSTVGDLFAKLASLVGVSTWLPIVAGVFGVLVGIRIVRWALSFIPTVNAGG
jgi:hypothetical protein